MNFIPFRDKTEITFKEELKMWSAVYTRSSRFYVNGYWLTYRESRGPYILKYP